MSIKRIAIAIAAIMIVSLLFCSCKKTETVESLSKVSKIDLPENTELVKYTKYEFLFRLSSINLHVRVPEEEINAFMSRYEENDEYYKVKGFSQGERLFIEWCGFQDEKEINETAIYMKDYPSPTSKTLHIGEIILMIEPEGGYSNVYIYKRLRD